MVFQITVQFLALSFPFLFNINAYLATLIFLTIPIVSLIIIGKKNKGAKIKTTYWILYAIESFLITLVFYFAFSFFLLNIVRLRVPNDPSVQMID